MKILNAVQLQEITGKGILRGMAETGRSASLHQDIT
jgi:hypothetical protein